MKLGDLKKSLGRFPPDMNDTEVIVQYGGENGGTEMDLLTFVAYANLSETQAAIFLGTWKALDRRVAEGLIEPPEDYRAHPDNEKKNTDTYEE
jgi:hypothetical protein